MRRRKKIEMIGDSGPNKSSGARRVGSKSRMSDLRQLLMVMRGKRGWQFQTFA